MMERRWREYRMALWAIVLLLAAALLLVALSAFASQSEEPPAAGQIIEALSAKGLPITGYVFQAPEASGRVAGPSRPMSVAVFRDSRLDASIPGRYSIEDGGAVEVFATAEQAQERRSSLGRFAPLPLMGEYGYVNGPAVLRLSRFMTPEMAAEYEAAFGAIGPAPVGEEEQR
jgi:hypothetical protein